MHLQGSKVVIFQESFSQEQEREEATWYQIYARVPKKVNFEKHCNLCKKHVGYNKPSSQPRDRM
jgi:hypothetical protein